MYKIVLKCDFRDYSFTNLLTNVSRTQIYGCAFSASKYFHSHLFVWLMWNHWLPLWCTCNHLRHPTHTHVHTGQMEACLCETLWAQAHISVGLHRTVYYFNSDFGYYMYMSHTRCQQLKFVLHCLHPFFQQLTYLTHIPAQHLLTN